MPTPMHTVDPVVLSIVLPVYNEAALLSDVVDEWVAELDRLQVRYELLLYDDGSGDETRRVLDTLARRHASVAVRRHANRGHGPTILRGYREARGEWILQADSDGEVAISGCRTFWDSRHDADLVIGRRVDRSSPWARRLITRISSISVRALFGPGIHDVNCPFRLMRADRLRPLLAHVPDDTFAPNVALSGLAIACGLRVIELPAPAIVRRRGAGSLAGFKAFRMAARSLAQTVRIARAPRGANGH